MHGKQRKGKKGGKFRHQTNHFSLQNIFPVVNDHHYIMINRMKFITSFD